MFLYAERRTDDIEENGCIHFQQDRDEQSTTVPVGTTCSRHWQRQQLVRVILTDGQLDIDTCNDDNE